jgi:hypothetical protein
MSGKDAQVKQHEEEAFYIESENQGQGGKVLKFPFVSIHCIISKGRARHASHGPKAANRQNKY